MSERRNERASEADRINLWHLYRSYNGPFAAERNVASSGAFVVVVFLLLVVDFSNFLRG